MNLLFLFIIRVKKKDFYKFFDKKAIKMISLLTLIQKNIIIQDKEFKNKKNFSRK